MKILKETIKPKSIAYDNRLAHTNLGVLRGKSEKDILGSSDYLSLERWRNRCIPIKDLKVSGMESPKIFWERTNAFINDVKNKGNFVIVVCTTFVAIQLFHTLMGNDYLSDAYRCIDVPLSGIIHFKEN